MMSRFGVLWRISGIKRFGLSILVKGRHSLMRRFGVLWRVRQGPNPLAVPAIPLAAGLDTEPALRAVKCPVRKSSRPGPAPSLLCRCLSAFEERTQEIDRLVFGRAPLHTAGLRQQRRCKML